MIVSHGVSFFQHIFKRFARYSLIALLLAISLSCNAAPIRVLIVYFSQNGHTEQLANAVAEGAHEIPNVEVKISRAQDGQVQDAIDADAIILGTAVYNANVAPMLQEYINSWPLHGSPMRDKIGAAFVTGGGISAGQESTQLSLLRSMMIFGMIIVGGEKWTSAFGAAAITGEQPFEGTNIDEHFLIKGRELGKRVARLAVLMHNNHIPEKI